MINLTYEDRLKINNHDFNYFHVERFDFSCGSFYVKFCSEEEAFKELLGKKVFDIAGIKCPNYYYEDKNYILSDDLKQIDNFMYMSDIPTIKKDMVWSPITLVMLINSVSDIVNNKEEIKLQINIMHFIDILFSNTDRHLNNYGLSIDKNGNGTLIVFDNGLFLDYFDCITKPISCGVNKFSFVKMRECDYFIKSLSDNDKRYIYALFSKFNPSTVSLIINKIEKENNYSFKCKNKLIKKYIKNYLMVYTVISKYINNNIRKEVNNEMKLSKSI